MKIQRIIFVLCLALFLSAPASQPAVAAINIIASTTELADIAQIVGGDKVSVYSIAKPNQDYHMIEPRPSDVARITHADIIVRIGMDLDMWMDALINAAGNPDVIRGRAGYVDCSVGIKKLEVPQEQITGASGDIHVFGNPHYFYDPENGKIIAQNILEGLKRISPENQNIFQNNYDRFAHEIDARIVAWQSELAPYRGQGVVIYHASAIYFLERFGLTEFGTLEPKPGIPPSASHIADLVKRMKEQKVRAVVIESIYPKRFPDLIAREVGVKYSIVPYNVGAMGAKDYFDLIDLWVKGYKAALSS